MLTIVQFPLTLDYMMEPYNRAEVGLRGGGGLLSNSSEALSPPLCQDLKTNSFAPCLT